MATAYKGKKHWGDDPILTIEDGKAYAGKKNWGEDPIATLEEGGQEGDLGLEYLAGTFFIPKGEQ